MLIIKGISQYGGGNWGWSRRKAEAIQDLRFRQWQPQKEPPRKKRTENTELFGSIRIWFIGCVVLLYEDLSRAIIGAAIEVHGNLGPGYLESVYENALAKELTARNIKFERRNFWRSFTKVRPWANSDRIFSSRRKSSSKQKLLLTLFMHTKLTRISHRLSTAAADPGMSTALRSFGLLDVLSSTPAGPSVARLVSMPVCAASLQKPVRNAG